MDGQGWLFPNESSAAADLSILPCESCLTDQASRAHGREERRQEGYEEAEHRAGENPGPRKNRQWLQSGRSTGEAQVLGCHPPDERSNLERQERTAGAPSC